MNNRLIVHPDGSLMRFFALPVLTDFNVRCAPILKNRTSQLVRLTS
ncbi:hypothetical protein C7476_106108 [Phyllobacterium bourgognense]|uniref:Uncharacterized protein n=1 Tax=Phyllobacterium bourgognense TaxID=314236 RepID=A0A368YS75_9HYPH|nr:hypothetical protein C7476_106108 [Phyllobacterium bourgognense]